MNKPQIVSAVQNEQQEQDTSKAMREKLVKILSLNLKKSSKFYEEDLSSIRQSVNKKSDVEVKESLLRANAIASVTQREINHHCRFK